MGGATSVGGGNPSNGGSGGHPLDIPGAGDNRAGMGGFVACEGTQSKAEGVGLDMYIVFDRSQSMRERPDMAGGGGRGNNGDCPIDLANAPATNSKWCLATNALAKFFTSPIDRDVRVAFQYMSSEKSEAECGASAENPHATPAVPFAQLPVPATHELVTTLDTGSPNVSGTNIEGSLNGLALFTSQNSAPPRTIVGVLITDGNPQAACQTDITELAKIPKAHFDATGIRTFVIGMTGATPANLEQLALSGGGPEHGPTFCDPADATCHYWTVGDGDPAAFASALEAIQVAVTIPCEYNLPDAGAGKSLDPDLVQVKFTPVSGAAQEFPRVDSSASCDAMQGGWYYDNNAAPKKISLCPASCDVATKSQSGATVSLAYGCKAAAPP